MGTLGNNPEWRSTIEQQGEKINRLAANMELLMGQLARLSPPRNDPPPLPREDEWYNNAEPPHVAVPRERMEKEKQELDKMKGKIEKLAKVVCKAQGVDNYWLELKGLFEGVKEKLPADFKMPDMDKFDGTGNPRNHLRMCIVAFQSRGLSYELMAILFQQTLTGAALSWYFTLEPCKTRVWEEVVKAFVTQYEYNQELGVTIRDLETTRQGYKESFAKFLTKWRGKAAKMINRPSEKEQVRMIVKNLQPEYLERMEFQSIVTFEQLFDIGARIEDAIRDGKIKRDNQGNKSKRPMCQDNHHELDVNALAPQSSFNRSTRILKRQGQCQNMSIMRKRPNRGPPREQRKFTDLDIPLSLALERMLKEGYLEKLGPRPIPDPIPPRYYVDEYCAYHQGYGHDTDRCLRLRHDIQDLIEQGIITPDDPRMIQ